ncbi:hypothetical protein SJA_C1-03010 [Sphingobium indicum UT26S]|uniref:Uncharacterized protein n=1 Tax=Sphingobium indicum (strain DSM 16413 / CCM 7287 / MTCC 6362 / UT26 / NBRC 101211 / UT26S) TaxID=452662 RepID=D4YXQ3_SPHIU|nr:hypothetical protein SJA_C1-03010 [Sphingobium indicum UT26S]
MRMRKDRPPLRIRINRHEARCVEAHTGRARFSTRRVSIQLNQIAALDSLVFRDFLIRDRFRSLGNRPRQRGQIQDLPDRLMRVDSRHSPFRHPGLDPGSRFLSESAPGSRQRDPGSSPG